MNSKELAAVLHSASRNSEVLVESQCGRQLSIVDYSLDLDRKEDKQLVLMVGDPTGERDTAVIVSDEPIRLASMKIENFYPDPIVQRHQACDLQIKLSFVNGMINSVQLMVDEHTVLTAINQ